MDGKYNNEEVIRGEIPFFVAYFDRDVVFTYASFIFCLYPWSYRPRDFFI